MLAPAARWRTFGRSLFIRVPLPAARTIATGEVVEEDFEELT